MKPDADLIPVYLTPEQRTWLEAQLSSLTINAGAPDAAETAAVVIGTLNAVRVAAPVA